MKILILEDNPVRIKIFNEMFQDMTVFVTEDTKECIDLLTNGKWDALFLDHDLAGTQNVPSGPGTGYEVACFLKHNSKYAPSLVIVHSHNVKGSTKMLEALSEIENVYRGWFGTFNRSSIIDHFLGVKSFPESDLKI